MGVLVGVGVGVGVDVGVEVGVGVGVSVGVAVGVGKIIGLSTAAPPASNKHRKISSGGNHSGITARLIKSPVLVSGCPVAG